MEKSRLEIKVGLFVLVGLTLLAVLLIQFSKGTSLFHGTYELRLHVGNVGGLKQRAAVLLAGVPVGSVSDIKLAPDGKSVTVLLRIYKNYDIYHDSRFVIEQSGFIGDQYVSIIPTANQPPLLQNEADVVCQEPFNLQEVARSASGFILRIDETAKKLDDAVSDVRRLVLNEQNLTNFSAAISNAVFFSGELARLANNVDNMVSTNSVDISASVKNIKSSTETLKQLMDDLQSGKGLAGTMLKNEQLATNVQEITDNLTITTSNLNQLGLWRFLWHRESPHTNEMTKKP